MFRSVFLFLFLLPLFIGCHARATAPPRPAPQVDVDEVQTRDVPVFLDTTGHAEAYEFVNIPARVSGFLREIRYTPGDTLPAGSPLFLIEPDQYKIAVQSAEASLASAKAQLRMTEANLARTKILVAEKTLPQENLDADQANRDEAAAGILKSQADLAQAKLNLSYTDVRSPIDGKVDRNLVDIGNLVGPSSLNTSNGISSTSGSNLTLTSVAGMSPIYIYFDISDAQFDKIRDMAPAKLPPETEALRKRLAEIKEARKQSELKANPQPPGSEPAKPVAATSDAEALRIPFQVGTIKGAQPNKTQYPFTGLIDMTSNTIDRSTGTIQVRGEIPNEHSEIYPGQICRVRIPLTTNPGALLIQSTAIMTDMNRSYVFVVDEKNVAHRRDVVLGDLQTDNTQVVLEGLKAGEKYVSLGTLKARNGKPITPTKK